MSFAIFIFFNWSKTLNLIFVQHIQLVLNLTVHDRFLLKQAHAFMVKTHWTIVVEYSIASAKGFEEGRSGNAKILEPSPLYKFRY